MTKPVSMIIYVYIFCTEDTAGCPHSTLILFVFTDFFSYGCEDFQSPMSIFGILKVLIYTLHKHKQMDKKNVRLILAYCVKLCVCLFDKYQFTCLYTHI